MGRVEVLRRLDRVALGRTYPNYAMSQSFMKLISTMTMKRHYHLPLKFVLPHGLPELLTDDHFPNSYTDVILPNPIGDGQRGRMYEWEIS